MKYSKEEIENAKASLLKSLKPGDTVYCVLRSVSKSGMSRRIDFYVIKNNEPLYLSGLIGIVLGIGRSMDKDGLKVDGCGMDMGFSVVYNLGSVLFPDGFTVDGIGRNGDTSGHDDDGGYALNHCWL
jgi:hypothetical protein